MGIGMRTAFILAIITGILVTGSFSNFMIPSAYAQSDLLIDLDGILSKLRGGLEFQNVSPGDPLTPFPPDDEPPVGSKVGIDFFDQVGVVGEFDDGDDLHAEDPDKCDTARFGGSFSPNSRDGKHNIDINEPTAPNEQIDCVILDDPAFNVPPTNNDPTTTHALYNGQDVDCDLETGGSPSERLLPFPCMVTNLTFFDENENGYYDLGEDIVLDLDGDGVYDAPECPPGQGGTPPDDCSPLVAGSLTPIDTTMVLVAGTHSVAAWMIPVIVSAIGFAIVIARKF